MISSAGSPSFHTQKNEHILWYTVERGTILFFEVSELILDHPRQLNIPSNLHDSPVNVPSNVIWAPMKNQGVAELHL